MGLKITDVHELVQMLHHSEVEQMLILFGKVAFPVWQDLADTGQRVDSSSILDLSPVDLFEAKNFVDGVGAKLVEDCEIGSKMECSSRPFTYNILRGNLWFQLVWWWF